VDRETDIASQAGDVVIMSTAGEPICFITQATGGKTTKADSCFREIFFQIALFIAPEENEP